MAFLMVANDLFALSGLFIAPEIPVEIEEVTTEEEFESPEVESTIDESSEVKRFEADLKYGIVGSGALDPLNSPSDDIFTIELSQGELNSLLGGHAYLRYEMRGVKDGLSIPKGINGSDTYGTMDFTPSETWSEQLEEIDSKDLWAGKNYVRFTIPSEYRASVEIRELEFVGSKEALQSKTLKSAKVASFSSTSGLAEYSGAKLFDAERTVQKGKVTALFTYETPSIPGDIINVTEGATAYRIESPSDITDLRIRIPLDESKIPAGYTTRDVKTYYFDYDHKRWQELPRYMDEGGEGDGSGLTTAYQGGTDYINGVIQAPEMPAASAFVPTSLSDIKAANPSAGMTMIQPPTINQQGTASIQYPLAIPKGRNGMQPNIALSYSSEGGESWVGYGWNIPTSSIQVDTRWGIPEFTSKESESYTLDGEVLVMEGDYLAHRPYDNGGTIEQINRATSTPKRFFRRVTKGHEEINRINTATTTYKWTVRNGDGTTFSYGSSNNSRLKNNNGDIVHWYLDEVKDKWGNKISYTYETVSFSNATKYNSLVEGGKAIYIKSVNYTGHDGSAGAYTIDFTIKYDGGSHPFARIDSRLNKKLGCHYVNGLLLDQITVKYGSTEVKNYKFHYSTGDFFKTLLTKVEERRGLDVFYDHEFEYYENSTLYGSSQDIETEVSSLLDNQLVIGPSMYSSPGDLAFLKEHSLIGTSNSKGLNGQLRLGVGFSLTGGWAPPSKTLTVGGYVGRTGSWGKGQSTLADVTGDGLPDLLYKPLFGSLKYREASRNGTSVSYSNTAQDFSSITSYYKTKDVSTNAGVEVCLNILGAGGYYGLDFGWSQSESRNYITDYNSDGIVDVVERISDDEYRVLFGRKNGSSIQHYSSSEYSPNPVRKGEALFSPDLDDLTQPNEVLKIWQAPFDGTISISGSASLGNSNSDDVRIGIQHNNSYKMSLSTLSPGGSLSTNVSSFTVDKDDYIILRAQPQGNHRVTDLTWDPTITYSGAPTRTDICGVNYNVSSPSNSFILDNDEGLLCTFNDNYTLTFNTVSVPSTCGDRLEFLVRVTTYELDATTGVPSFDSEVEYTAYKSGGHTLVLSDLKDPSLNTPATINAPGSGYVNYIEFEVNSDVNIDWTQLDWRPIVECPSKDVLFFPNVDYSIYNVVEKFASGDTTDSDYYTDLSSNPVSIFYVQPELVASNFADLNTAAPVTAHMTVGVDDDWKNGAGPTQITYNYSGGVGSFTITPGLCSTGSSCSGGVSVTKTESEGEDFHVAFYTKSKKFAKLLAAHGAYRVLQNVSSNERQSLSTV